MRTRSSGVPTPTSLGCTREPCDSHKWYWEWRCPLRSNPHWWRRRAINADSRVSRIGGEDRGKNAISGKVRGAEHSRRSTKREPISPLQLYLVTPRKRWGDLVYVDGEPMSVAPRLACEMCQKPFHRHCRVHDLCLPTIVKDIVGHRIRHGSQESVLTPNGGGEPSNAAY
jgi:hypothetical protein